MSSRIAGGSGSFGAAGWAADAASPGAGAVVGAPIAGATGFVFVFAGTSGFTAALVIFGVAFSCFPVAGSADFALAFVAAVVPSADDATAGSVFGAASVAGSFFVAGVLSFFGVSLAGVDGTIDAILSFSTRTYPKSVLTLNMLSSYDTITPYSFLPSFKRISSARAESAAA